MKFTVNENPQRFLNEEVEKVYHMHDGSFSVAVDRMEEKESLLLFSRFRLHQVGDCGRIKKEGVCYGRKTVADPDDQQRRLSSEIGTGCPKRYFDASSPV